ncbi:MAG: hypothetical protein IPK84_02545 [Candidatus Moraniibacteriota bacterium]|nr:MAG: hypothetical protein IPK84_02545 [Candidatus Moranbacteria bacterium]
MWDQLEIASERVKRLVWLFLAFLITAHIIAIFFVYMKMQTLIPILAIISAFITIAQAARLKIWLASAGAGIAFGLLPIAQTARSVGDFSLWAWKSITHVALGTSLALFLIAEIPWNGDASLALEFDTALMILALVALTYIEREVVWYPTLVRSLIGFVIAIILISVFLGIAYPEASKVERWWKFLEFAKDHWLGILITIGAIIFLWKIKGAHITAIPGWIFILALILAVGAALIYAYRDWDSVKHGAREVQGFLNKATSRNVEFSRVETVSVKAAGRGYFVLTVHPDQLTYWGTCGNGRKLHGIAVKNDETRAMHGADVNLDRGNIVIGSGSGQASRHQDLIYIEDESAPLSVYLDFPGENPSRCKIDRLLKATLYFTPKDV